MNTCRLCLLTYNRDPGNGERSGKGWVLFFNYQTTFLASLRVRTAIDVAKPSVVSRVLTSMAVSEHVVAALLDETKGVRASSRCVRETGKIRAVESGRKWKTKEWRM